MPQNQASIRTYLSALRIVIPAKAGLHGRYNPLFYIWLTSVWIPAFAGMT